ncbi:MAG: hypothetical protein VXY89_00890, partial [SAR324 cluster bacterium]|nr:hypothetical protein [SAR324 cluster bacterium]
MRRKNPSSKSYLLKDPDYAFENLNRRRKVQQLDLSDIKHVLIENQPALKNPTMKSVQMIIYTFFIMNGIMNDNS